VWSRRSCARGEGASAAVVSGGAAEERWRACGAGVERAWRGHGGAVRERRRSRAFEARAGGGAVEQRRWRGERAKTQVRGRQFREEEERIETDVRGSQKG